MEAPWTASSLTQDTPWPLSVRSQLKKFRCIMICDKAQRTDNGCYIANNKVKIRLWKNENQALQQKRFTCLRDDVFPFSAKTSFGMGIQSCTVSVKHVLCGFACTVKYLSARQQLSLRGRQNFDAAHLPHTGHAKHTCVQTAGGLPRMTTKKSAPFRFVSAIHHSIHFQLYLIALISFHNSND